MASRYSGENSVSSGIMLFNQSGGVAACLQYLYGTANRE